MKRNRSVLRGILIISGARFTLVISLQGRFAFVSHFNGRNGFVPDEKLANSLVAKESRLGMLEELYQNYSLTNFSAYSVSKLICKLIFFRVACRARHDLDIDSTYIQSPAVDCL